MPSYEYRDGELVEVPDIVVSESGDLHEDVKQTLVVESGVMLTTHGRISGTVEIQPGATLNAQSDVSGTVSVAATAEATFHGRMSGTLTVSPGGVATLAPSAIALGVMKIDGTLINEGTRGVRVHGTGAVEDREGSTVCPPDEHREDGTVVYYG